METGDCYIVPPRQRHALWGDAERPFDFLNVVYSGRVPRRLTGAVLALTAEERRLLGALKSEDEDRLLHYREAMLCRFNLFLLLLERRTRESPHADPALPENRLHYRSAVVRRALSYLAIRHARPLDAAAVSRHAGVSPSHLRHLVKTETGMSLRQHLRALRIEEAKRLLRAAPDNVDSVAYKVGYRSVPHFCTVFKRLVRMTPSAYARSLG